MITLTPRRFASLGVFTAGLFLAARFAAADPTDHNLYYDPGSTNTTNTGGTGTSSNSVWYDGVSRVAWATGVSGSIATYWNLYFGGEGQSSPYTYTTAISTLALPTGSASAVNQLNLYFQGDYTYTKSSSQTNTSTIGSQASESNGKYSYLNVYVDPGKTLKFVAGTDANDTNQITLISTANNSSTPSILLSGGGTVEIGHHVNITQYNSTSSNGHLHVGEADAATTLTAKTGSTITAHRLQLANGTINIDGAVATMSDASSARSNSALILGGAGTAAEGYAPVTFNLNSGSVTALPGTANTYGAHGIAIGTNPNSTSTTAFNDQVGGTLNLNGGTLTTTDIMANPNASAAVTAKVVFNGGALVVSSKATQAQLDNFITGFQNTTDNHVAIAAGGAFIDTGSIDTDLTNGVATISSAIGGTGGLTKQGANTLKLDGLNTFAGATTISAGTLALGANGGLTSNTITVADGATFDVSAVANGFRVAAGQNIATAGTGVVSGTLAFGEAGAADAIVFSDKLNLASGSALLFDIGSSSDVLSVADSVTFLGTTTIGINPLLDFTTGTYVLVESPSITGYEWLTLGDSLPDGYMFTLNTSASAISVTVAAAAVPEPATYALLLGGIAVAGAWLRRRRCS